MSVAVLVAPWLSLAVLTDFAQEAELADRIVAAERGMAGAAPLERALYQYALGKAHADRGEALGISFLQAAGCGDAIRQAQEIADVGGIGAHISPYLRPS